MDDTQPFLIASRSVHETVNDNISWVWPSSGKSSSCHPIMTYSKLDYFVPFRMIHFGLHSTHVYEDDGLLFYTIK